MTKQEWREEFARRLRRLSHKSGFNKQKDLAEAIGLNEMTISNYRNCTRTPDAITIANLAFVLNCSVEDLIPYDEIIED